MSHEPPALAAFLRRETGSAHQSMEASLDLLGPAMDAARMRQVLGRFMGFHLVWEAGLSAWPAINGFAAPRSRLDHLRHDLTALGRTPAEIDRTPVCSAAAALTRSEAMALGSFYVLEGSTLGGQVVSRHLAGTGWAPPGGLSYFNPYGARTGEMWRDFRTWLDSHPAGRDRASSAEGARRTFALLEAWLAA